MKKISQTLKTNAYLDTCKCSGRKAISQNLMTPKDQARSNYERLRYEQSIWNQEKEQRLGSAIETIGSIVILMFFMLAMGLLFAIIH